MIWPDKETTKAVDICSQPIWFVCFWNTFLDSIEWLANKEVSALFNYQRFQYYIHLLDELM